jgi:hypothetical protein
MTLLHHSELNALAEFAEALFNSRVEIYYHSIQTAGDSWDDSVSAEIEDDTTPSVVVDGWFRNQPDYQTSDALAAIAHEEDGRLFVPLGTVLGRQDKVVVYARDVETGEATGTGTAYRVIDTNYENTYRVLIRVSLRRIS